MNLRELLNFAEDEGKLAVIDQDGKVLGVFLSPDQYERLKHGTVTKPTPQVSPDPEAVNRAITQVQLQEVDLMPPATTAHTVPQQLPQPHPSGTAVHINTLISERAQELFRSMPFGRMPQPTVDLREQVIDPNFNFGTADNGEDEEIKTSFEDI